MASNSSRDGLATCGRMYFLAALLASYCCILPLYLAVLFIGFQRWRRRSSGSVALATSHMDVITYNLVAIEMIAVLSMCLLLSGLVKHHPSLVKGSSYLAIGTVVGLSLFHTLTSVERYLAVLHPVSYLSLRSSGTVRIRNLFVGGVWLVCGVWVGLVRVYQAMVQLFLILEASSLLVVSFCCLNVLRALIRPKPGDGGGTRASSDRSEKRALYTMTATMGALVTRFLVNMIFFVMTVVMPLSYIQCLASMLGLYLVAPSSFMLPLLFLHRARKLTSCRRRTMTGTNQTS